MFKWTVISILMIGSALGANQSALMDWFRLNSESLVMLKYLDKVVANSTVWQEVKNSTQVQQDLRELQSLLQSSDGDVNGTTSVPCAVDCAASDNLIEARSSADSVDNIKANLTDRNDQLEPTHLQANATHQRTNETDNSQSITAVNGSTDPLQQLTDRHEDDMKWVRSQFIPLNYLFGKLQKMEDDAQLLRDLVAKERNQTSDVDQKSEMNTKLEKLDHQFEKFEPLSEKINEMEERMDSIHKLINETNQHVQDLQSKNLHLATRPVSSSNGTEEPEYCPDRLDEMVPCAEVGDWCYCFSKQQRNWSDAIEYCKKNDMDLLNLETEKETYLIHTYIKRSGLPQDFYWTSGSDDAVEGKWVWAATQKELTYTNWRSNQPDGGRKENCLYLHSRDDHKWGDWLCSMPQHFICEW